MKLKVQAWVQSSFANALVDAFLFQAAPLLRAFYNPDCCANTRLFGKAEEQRRESLYNFFLYTSSFRIPTYLTSSPPCILCINYIPSVRKSLQSIRSYQLAILSITSSYRSIHRLLEHLCKGNSINSTISGQTTATTNQYPGSIQLRLLGSQSSRNTSKLHSTSLLINRPLLI